MLDNFLNELKQDIEKDIELNIDMSKLAQSLYPYIKELQNKDIENIMAKHKEDLYKRIRR